MINEEESLVAPFPETLAELRQVAPGAASGRIRRLRDGVVQDAAVFLYLAPTRWRVRHQSGTEIVVHGADWWERESAAAAWRHNRAELGTTVHHNGDLQGMLFPARLPAIGDVRSVVTAQQVLDNGDRRLTIRYREPVEGTATADVSPDGHLARFEGWENRAVVIELRVDSWDPPRNELFDPEVTWEASFDE
jgi:hypothetical protein